MIHRSSLCRFASFALLALTLAACASDRSDDLPPDRPVEELYNEASAKMEAKEYQAAAKAFQEVERQHPYSVWSARAQLMTAYAYYRDMDYDKAIAALDGYIQTHPASKDIAYAYYLRALCDYERIVDVRRDQSYAQSSLSGLEAIVRRFPDTSYAKDAQLKISLVHDHLAGAEMEIGRHYQKQKLFIAAVGRFRAVIEKYQTTSHVPESLHRLVECYLSLGIPDEAKAVAAVLGHNFPGSKWYENSYNLLVKNNLTPERKKTSWVDELW